MRVRDLGVKMGLDWGSSSPGCVLWGVGLADNHAHIFDELKFQRMAVSEVAEAIRDKTLSEWNLREMPPIYCDPALKIKTGQVGEDFIQTFARHKVRLIPVSNNRQVGWQRCHEALSLDKNTGTPWLTIHPRCKYLARTIPQMIQKDTDPEDLDSESDDHGCDAWRYLMMGGLRPSSKSLVVAVQREGSWGAFKKMAKRMAA